MAKFLACNFFFSFFFFFFFSKLLFEFFFQNEMKMICLPNGNIPCVQIFSKLSKFFLLTFFLSKFFIHILFDIFFKLYRTIDVTLIVRQLIKNIPFRTRHCMHTNTAFSTEIGRKASYTTWEKSERFLPSVKLHKITQTYTFLPVLLEKAVFVCVQWRERN